MTSKEEYQKLLELEEDKKYKVILSPKELKKLEPFLIGTPKQFITYQGDNYCVREECEGCPHIANCEFEIDKIQSSPVLHPRRGIAFENRSFLILLLKKDLDFEKDVPRKLWDSEYSNFALDERNVHYILANQRAVFRVLKGQFRYYGTKEEFAQSEYFKYFDIFNEYVPKHYVMAMDLSSIEPRVSTIASREPEWIKIFKGKPKVVAKEIKLEEDKNE